jgi:hypothetical protein
MLVLIKVETWCFEVASTFVLLMTFAELDSR